MKSMEEFRSIRGNWEKRFRLVETGMQEIKGLLLKSERMGGLEKSSPLATQLSGLSILLVAITLLYLVFWMRNPVVFNVTLEGIIDEIKRSLPSPPICPTANDLLHELDVSYIRSHCPSVEEVVAEVKRSLPPPPIVGPLGTYLAVSTGKVKQTTSYFADKARDSTGYGQYKAGETYGRLYDRVSGAGYGRLPD